MVPTRERTAERAPARLQVNYSYEGCYLISFSENLSADGIHISTDCPAPVGSHLTLVFPFPHAQEIAVAARVVWSRPKGEAGQGGMGLQFLDLPPRARETFLEIVNRIAILGADLGVSGRPSGTA